MELAKAEEARLEAEWAAAAAAEAAFLERQAAAAEAAAAATAARRSKAALEWKPPPTPSIPLGKLCPLAQSNEFWLQSLSSCTRCTVHLHTLAVQF